MPAATAGFGSDPGIRIVRAPEHAQRLAHRRRATGAHRAQPADARHRAPARELPDQRRGRERSRTVGEERTPRAARRGSGSDLRVESSSPVREPSTTGRSPGRFVVNGSRSHRYPCSRPRPPPERQSPPLSSRGLGRRPLTAETRVRIPVAVLQNPRVDGGFVVLGVVRHSVRHSRYRLRRV